MDAVLRLVAGIALLVGAAEMVVRGGTRVAAHFRVPPLVVGLTVVAVGTSAPELAVGIDAALRGVGTLAVGNVAGTNTANLLLILGLSALIRPMSLHPRAVRVDLPVMVAAAVALIALSWDGSIDRIDGAVLLIGGVVYMAGTVRSERRRPDRSPSELELEVESEAETEGPDGVGRNLAILLTGVVLIVLGADLLVDAAVDVAMDLGVSDAFIGLTVVALGTSAPELVTMLVSTFRGGRDVAIGNILGSSTLNIVVILAVTALVPSDGIDVGEHLLRIDLPVMGLATLACIPVFLNDRRISRLEGALFFGAYVTYLSTLVLTRT